MNGTSHAPRLSRRQFVVAGTVAAASFAWTGCGGNQTGSNGAGGENGEPLIMRFGYSGEAPSTLDPARRHAEALAYDPLIEVKADGTLVPRLAESWSYVGEENTTFEIRLRPDVTFSDDEPLNAEAVRANIEYYRDPEVGSQAQQYLAAVSEVEVVDELTVRIHLSEPQPLMPQVFGSHHYWAGYMMSPAAIADSEKLATGTYGAGKYVLDPDETVHGDHYTYVPNPSYWDPDAVLWDKVVVSYRPDENATLAALRSGQLDVALASYAVAEAGVDAGFQAVGPGTPIVLGLSLWDRDGKVTPALGDVRVRQALNYAVDRETITAALIGDFGVATDQLSAPNQAGWNEDRYYSYDPDRARQLLADAGYGDGFTMPVRTNREEFTGRVVQAVRDDLRKIGVTLDIASDPQYDQADDDTNREFAAGLIGWGISPAYLMGRSFWLPDATNNPFDSADETLVELDLEAATAEIESQAELDRQIIGRVAEQGWFLPVFLFGNSLLYDDAVVEVPSVEQGQDLPQADLYRPAGG